MPGFTAPPPSAAPPEPPAPIAHDDFFPGVTLADVRASQRIPTQVTDIRLTDAIIGAMLTVDSELGAWRDAQVAAGKATLAAVSDAQLAGQPRLVRLYQRAIGAFAAADLADTQHDIGATEAGKKRIEDSALSSDDLRRNGTHAIRDMLGAPRAAVELI